MNPWDILVWILAGCIAVLAILATVGISAGIIRGIFRRRPADNTVPIVRTNGQRQR